MSYEQLPYHERLRLIKLGQLPKEAIPKPKKYLAKVSKKRAEQLKKDKEAGTDADMDLFFASMRHKMKGRCLFCNGVTNRDNEDTFHFCLAHLMPKAIFKSIATHEENIIELCFYQKSCHTNFDNGIITWEFIKDSKEWEIIREKLFILLPLVAPEERKHKLYSRLTELVYG